MKKLKAVVQYECMTSFKYIWVFYAIQYAFVALIMLIIGISMGTFEEIGTSLLEINSLIYVGILGALGFSQDFKMLIQNGFTRKIIFAATMSMFLFISGIYGYNNVFMNWLWLFLIYVLDCCLLYLMVLAINKVRRTILIYSCVGLGGAVLAIIALFKYVFSEQTVNKIGDFFMRAMGFMGDGTVNYFFPVVTLGLIISVLSCGAFAVMRSTELK